MLGILKVNAGIGTDGSAEFSVTLVDVKDQVYEVDIDDRSYAQLVGIIEETTGVTTNKAPDPSAPLVDPSLAEAPDNGNGLNSLSDEKREAIARLLADSQPDSVPEAPQHHVEGDQPPERAVRAPSMSDVGFVDYSADLYDDDEEVDPGEDLVGFEDEYVEPI